MLQPFLCHHQLYFLLLVSDLIFHLWLWTLIFHLLLESHLLLTFNMCLQSKSACLLFYCFIMCNVVNITCCIDMVSFRDTFHIVLCPQNKTFVDKFRNILDLAIVVANLLKNWLPYSGFSFPSLTCLIFKVQCLKKSNSFHQSFLVFLIKEYLFFLFLTYLHPILHKNKFL